MAIVASILHKSDKGGSFYPNTALKLLFARYLDQHVDVVKYEYRKQVVDYIDNFSGKKKKYYVDFTIYYNNNIEYVEVKPLKSQYPLTKYLYAQNKLNWRFINESELSFIAQNLISKT